MDADFEWDEGEVDVLAVVEEGEDFGMGGTPVVVWEEIWARLGGMFDDRGEIEGKLGRNRGVDMRQLSGIEVI